MSEPQVATIDTPKHVVLYSSITKLSSMIERLDALADRVEGSAAPAKECSVEPCAESNIPALNVVLTESPERLASLAKSVSLVHDRLEALLFWSSSVP